MSESVMITPDYLEPLLGYRVWATDGPRLISLADGRGWEPYKAKEAAHVGFHGWAEKCHESPCWRHVPYLRPGCGIYAYKTLDDLRRGLEEDERNYELYAIGSIWLWGRIVEHEWGYRAQYAYPAAIFTHRAIADAYGVPFTPKEEIDTWKSDFPIDESYQSPFPSLFLWNLPKWWSPPKWWSLPQWSTHLQPTRISLSPTPSLPRPSRSSRQR